MQFIQSNHLVGWEMDNIPKIDIQDGTHFVQQGEELVFLDPGGPSGGIDFHIHTVVEVVDELPFQR